MSNEDMFIDPDTFDFSKLDDIVETPAAPKGKAAKEAPAVDLTDASDLPSGEFEENEDEFIDVPEDEEVEEEESADEEDEAEPAVDEDGEIVDFDNTEITLPNGEQVVLSELVKGYKNTQALEAEKAEFEAQRDIVFNETKEIRRQVELAKLEADKALEDFADYDWKRSARETPEEYAEYKEYVEGFSKRRKELVAELDSIEAKRDKEEADRLMAKGRSAWLICSQEIPEWSADYYQELCKFASEQGAGDDIWEVRDAWAIKLIHKAYKASKDDAVVKAKVKRIGAPTKVAKATDKPTPTKGAAKHKVLKAMQTGNLTDDEMFRAYAFVD